ncbi:hypothetical protein ASPCAL14793 [Aspergillus calidoustus]|uniref:Uncharacterized protein n=1 Tax=Aspergillus calidoustus TaxID=454130 RepID=A0A0U5GLG9_ASPCI|nr:hypothetical protein ASPCAL14793 [Aspergillus calidoustus]
MSCFSSLLSCCLPTKALKSPETQQTPTTPPHLCSTNNNTHGPPQDQDGYNTVVPLPAYTPRPMSIHEKTLEAHMRDPPISSETYHHHHHTEPQSNINPYTLSTDEKQRLAWEEATGTTPDPNTHHTDTTSPNYYYPYYTHPRPEEVTSDVSSALSFPSSYGNTSTATRETPPPPYSPPVLSPAPSRSMSISSAYRHPHPGFPGPMVALTQPPPVFQRPDVPGAGRFTPPRASIDEQIAGAGARVRRFSWESR